MTRQTLTARLRIPAAIALAGYWICLFIGTHVPQPEKFISPNLWDKGLHVFAYGGLAALVLLNLLLRAPLRWSRVAVVIALVTAVGLFDEVTQIPVGRHFDLLDLTADVIGATVASAVVAVIAVAIDRMPGRGLPQA